MTPHETTPHALSVDEVLTGWKVNKDRGLTSRQAAENLEKYGPNELASEPGKTMWQLLLEQFEDLLVRILLGAAAVSFLLAFIDDESSHVGLSAYVEPFVILLILIANAIVGVWQETNAEKALEALKKLQPETAMVLRDGRLERIDSSMVVPGDIVEVRVGDRVPADMRLVALKTTTLRIEQSQLTGESVSVAKELEKVDDMECVIQAKTNMLFSSTTVSNGVCQGVVTATGMQTEIGIIQQAVQSASEEECQTPLQKKINEFGDQLAKVIFVICLLVWLINYQHFFDPMHGSVLRGCIYYFKIAVALAVAAIPEGLPAVITTCLALGTRKMAKRNCIVRKLPSVETLGCTTVICSDKTGTLTTNEMCVVKLVMPDGRDGLVVRDVKGHTYKPVGAVENHAAIGSNDVALATLAKVAVFCNESRIKVEEDTYVRIGEPTEAALIVLAEKLGCPDDLLNARCLQKAHRAPRDAMAFCDYWTRNFKSHALLEFSRDRKSMSVIGEDGSGGNQLYCKGAPENVVERCTHIMAPNGKVELLTPMMKERILDSVQNLAEIALRTLAFAIKNDVGQLRDYNGPQHPQHKLLTNPNNFVLVEQDMTFLGLVGVHDPPRPECRESIDACRTAGVSVIMITGDNKSTAEAISENLGILTHNAAGRSLTGKEFEKLSESAQRAVLQKMVTGQNTGGVFSRTEPKHKQIIVKILKQIGEVPAMTGDGVNDAPALKQADIGIAMGITGTEVAKEASDMILTDDNFATIVAAIEEGRSIYNNMKAFIRYLISSNIGEVVSIFLTAALGIPEGLAPVQLLWVNLVTDGPPATALGFNPADLDVMLRPPRRKDDKLISGWVFFRYMVIGLYVGFATVGIFIYWFTMDQAAPDQHTLVSFEQLASWGKCNTWTDFAPRGYMDFDFSTDPCSYFTVGKIKAGTLSLTVLVVIEMLNALNALSEDGSLIQMPPWRNPFLIIAIVGSIGIHACVLYVPFMSTIFSVVPLDVHDWTLVMIFSFPVIILDEILKLVGRLQRQARVQTITKFD
eukprot:GEMP01002946.1.p1 GENE.GEMP01002946.1~~GEMP01002946.1.p1  ORF type:complete len:1031 (-),score=288.25 GEMP01002946.1:1471-4563(-)